METKCCGLPIEPPHRQTQILIAVDEGDPSHWAVQVGSRMAQELSARVVLLNVVVPMTAIIGESATIQQRLERAHIQEGQDLLKRAHRDMPPGVPCEELVRDGNPAEEILDVAATRECDMIVMGTHARGRVSQLVLGSNAEKVIHHATCPVITVGHQSNWALRSRATHVEGQFSEAH